MMQVKLLFMAFVWLLMIHAAYAQPFTPGKTYTTADTVIIKNKIDQSYLLLQVNKTDSALLVVGQALDISRSINYTTGICRAFLYQATAEKNRNNFSASLAYADSAMLYSQRYNYLPGTASSYNQKGNVNFELANYTIAIDNYFKALPIYEKINKQDGILSVYNNLALCYNHLKDYNRSLEYHRMSMEMEKQRNNPTGQAASLRNMGNVYQNLVMMDTALAYYYQSLQIELGSGNMVGAGVSYMMIGSTFVLQHKPDSALHFLFKAHEIFKPDVSPLYLAEVCTNIGEAYGQQLNDSLSSYYFNKAFDLYTKLDVPGKMAVLKDKMSEYNEKRGNYKQALVYFKQAKEISDTLFTLEKATAIEQLEATWRLTKKQQQLLQVENEKKLTETQLQLRNEQLLKARLLNTQNEQEIIMANQQVVLTKKDNEIKTLAVQQNTLALEAQKLQTEQTVQQLALTLKESALKDAKLQAQKLKQQISVAGIFAVIAVGAYVYVLYLKRKKLTVQLSSSLTQLKQTQTQLIQLEKEKEAEAIRLRISRDIHDDIGSSLTKIAMLGNLTSAHVKNKMPEITPQLESISNYARSVNNSMSEIVWAVNPKQDTLENLLGYMRIHTQEFLKDSGINFSINFPEAVPAIQLNPDLKRGLFLVLKESLNNAVKHAAAKNIIVSLLLQSNHFELSIVDDGKGIKTDCADRASSGNGLSNLEARMKQAGCSFTVVSSYGNGCTVTAAGNL